MLRVFRTTLGLCLALAAGRLGGQTVFGTTNTSLVTVDVATGATTAVGALNLPANTFFNALTWHPGEQRLYGFAYTLVGGVVTEQYLGRIDPATGAATTLVAYGAHASSLVYEGFTYVAPLGQFVVSRAQTIPSTLSRDFLTMSTTGAVAPLVTTGATIDSDTIVYDAVHSVLYTIDPNGDNVLRKVNLVTGATTDVGTGTSANTGAMTYSPFTNRLYGISYATADNSLWVLDPNNGAGPLSLVATLTTSGSQLTAIAVAVPEPAAWVAWAAMAGLAVAIGLRKRRDRSRGFPGTLLDGGRRAAAADWHERR